MARFETSNVDFELNGDKYTIGPLDGANLGLFYQILDSMELDDEKEMTSKDIFKTFNKENVTIIHRLLLVTFAEAYPKEDKKVLDGFISQNIMILFNYLMQANLTRLGVKDVKPE